MRRSPAAGPVSADTRASPNAGTGRAPNGSDGGTARTMPSASGSATVWPTFGSRGAAGLTRGVADETTATTSTVWAAWASSASLAAPPRPGALGVPSGTSRPTTAAPPRPSAATTRASIVRSQAPAPKRASLEGSRATMTSRGVSATGARERSQRSYTDQSSAATLAHERGAQRLVALARQPRVVHPESRAVLAERLLDGLALGRRPA